MAMIDEETRQIILRKTWCHGQAILPGYAVLLLAWWMHMEAPRPFQLILASVVLPIWAWYTYNAILVIDWNGRLPHAKICGFGAIAMLAHVLVFTVAIQDLSDTWHMLMTIASGLFFVETGAFLLVVSVFRREVTTSQNEPLHRNEMLC